MIGLDLCPFAGSAWQEQKIRLTISNSSVQEDLLRDLYEEVRFLEQNQSTETTLLVIPGCLESFDEYNQFLDLCDSLLAQYDWNGEFQIASFHPEYQFSGTHPDDRENWTNRSPYPVLHLLREKSLTKALANHPCPEKIPEINIEKLNSLDECDFKRIFSAKNN